MSPRERLLDISYRHGLSHLGSVLTALPIIEGIYKIKKPSDRFILSEGHAGLALYCVLESLGFGNAEEMLEKQGIHPDRPNSNGSIDCSTGSLGQGLPIAVGMALADKNKQVYCLISDGECAEGSIWEALRIAEQQGLDNLQIHVNANGWGAYDAIDLGKLIPRLLDFSLDIHIHKNTVDQFPFLYGLAAHYLVMSREQYESTRT